MTKTQKILLGVIAVVLLSAGGFALYYFYFKKAPTTVKGPEQPGQITISPQQSIEVIDSKLKKISRAEAVSPVASADGKKLVYISKEGGVLELDFTGENVKETKSTFPLQNLFKVLWSRDRTVFAAVYANPDGRKISYYNIAAKQTGSYDSTISALAFSKTDDRIAYHSVNDALGINAFFTANQDGTAAQQVLPTRLQDARIEWLGNGKLAVSTAPSGLAQNMLWLLDMTTKKMSAVLSNMNGLTFLWSPKGDRVLFSQTGDNGKGLSLSATNQNGGEIKKLSVQTLPEKCVFSQDGVSAVCAAPKTAPDIVWPDDYYKGLYDTQEQVWNINLETGKQNLLYEFTRDKNFDIVSPVLSQDGTYLAFVNKKDGHLYSLKVK